MVQLSLLLETNSSTSFSDKASVAEEWSVDDNASTSEEEIDTYFGDNDDSEEENSEQTSPSRSSISRRTSQSFKVEFEEEDVMPFDCRLVFLTLSDTCDSLVPFLVRIIKVSDSLNLLVLSESPSAEVAISIHNSLDVLYCAQYSKSELSGFISLHKLEHSFAILNKVFKKSKRAKNLSKAIDDLIGSDFKLTCLELEVRELPTVIEAKCSALCDSLRRIYLSMVYFEELSRLEDAEKDKEHTAHLDSLRIYCEQRVADYVEYLQVKSKRNMTLEPFLEIVDSLVAFVYVDRCRNEIVYASCEDLKVEKSPDSEEQEFNLLAEAVELAYTSLASGNLSSKWNLTEKSLTFNYYMWFEDLAGRPLVPNVTDFTLAHYPSFCGTDFIQEIVSKVFITDQLVNGQTVACFELLFVQKTPLSPESSEESLLQAKRLAAKLWEVTSSSSLSADGMWTFI